MGEITRQQFAMLCNPVKHYLMDKIGMDELNAGLMAANIVAAQQETLLRLLPTHTKLPQSGKEKK